MIFVNCNKFNDLEYNFIHRNIKNDIDALITLGYNKGSSILTLTNLICKNNEENLLKQLINYVFDNVSFLTKIRFLIEKDKLVNVEKLIQRLGVTTEAILKKEFGEKDLIIYSIVK